jgi:hypothetical protein
MNNLMIGNYRIENSNIILIILTIIFSGGFFYLNGNLVKENYVLEKKLTKLKKVENKNQDLLLSISKKEEIINKYKRKVSLDMNKFYTLDESDSFLKYINDIIVKTNMRLINFDKSNIDYIYNDNEKKEFKIFEVRSFQLTLNGSWISFLKMKEKIKKIDKKIFISNESIISKKENGIVEIKLKLLIYSFYNKNILKQKVQNNETSK